jgi:DNA-binding transcriptional LysR family regulator
MPQAIAREFTPVSRFRLLETELPSKDFTVSVHWSRRHGHSALVQWARSVLLGLFGGD